MRFLGKKNKRAANNQDKQGAAEERLAKNYLRKHGLKTLECNYHSRYGEIDIIMLDKETIVFIEVRARKKHAQVSAIESINSQKINKIRLTAQRYLQRYDELPECRFDFIGITTDNSTNLTKDEQIEWIKDVF